MQAGDLEKTVRQAPKAGKNTAGPAFWDCLRGRKRAERPDRNRYLFQSALMFWLCSVMAAYQGDETTGFQSPAQDYIEPVVDLAAMLSLREPGKYPVRVVGQALRERGIHHGDILIANAAADPRPGRVCVAIIGCDVILATLLLKDGSWLLKPSSREAVAVTGDTEVWAIVEALVRMKV